MIAQSDLGPTRLTGFKGFAHSFNSRLLRHNKIAIKEALLQCKEGLSSNQTDNVIECLDIALELLFKDLKIETNRISGFNCELERITNSQDSRYESTDSLRTATNYHLNTLLVGARTSLPLSPRYRPAEILLETLQVKSLLTRAQKFDQDSSEQRERLLRDAFVKLNKAISKI